MPSITCKFAAISSLAGAIALSAIPTEAQSARKKPVNRSVATSSQYQPYAARAYYAPVRSGGINYDSRMGANYNPNQ